jgi:hypothetical protein
MVKTVVVVLGCIGVLLGISPHPSAREQASPTPPPPSPSASSPEVQLPWTGHYFVETIQAGKTTTEPAAPQTAGEQADQAAIADAAKALDDLRSKYRCTYALKMMETDPDFDAKIKIDAPSGGDAKIRRIGPPPCPNLLVQHKSMGGRIRIIPAQKK